MLQARPAAHASGLAEVLRERTRTLHAQAERSGIVCEILRGRASREGYALLLRNLLPAYEGLERGLERHRDAPGLSALATANVYRAPALRSDLAALAGSGWRRALPLLASGRRYAALVAAAAEGDGLRLVAHAYVRYLGDLSGGQVLRQVLSRSLGLGREGLAFYDFPAIADIDAFRSAYREALDRLPLAADQVEGIAQEAARAFESNIEVSEGVQAVAVRRAARTPRRSNCTRPRA